MNNWSWGQDFGDEIFACANSPGLLSYMSREVCYCGVGSGRVVERVPSTMAVVELHMLLTLSVWDEEWPCQICMYLCWTCQVGDVVMGAFVLW